MLVHAKYLVNSFHVTVRVPPEILTKICTHLATEEDIFSASQVCNHWRSVLTSSPSLWTQFSCRHVPRTIVSLERCKSMPIRLKFAPRSSTVALESVLLRGNKITSLAVQPYVNPVPLLHQLFMHSRPTVEQLHIYTNTHRTDESAAREIWQDLPSLRELFVYRYSIPIDHLVAPNLVHLAWNKEGTTPLSNLPWICSVAVLCWKPSLSSTQATTRTRLAITPPFPFYTSAASNWVRLRSILD